MFSSSLFFILLKELNFNIKTRLKFWMELPGFRMRINIKDKTDTKSSIRLFLK